MTTCRTCGRQYAPGNDDRQRHRLLLGHTPSPEPVREPVDLDAVVREIEAEQRRRPRTKGGEA